jgi:hypothetical protein
MLKSSAKTKSAPIAGVNQIAAKKEWRKRKLAQCRLSSMMAWPMLVSFCVLLSTQLGPPRMMNIRTLGMPEAKAAIWACGKVKAS